MAAARQPGLATPRLGRAGAQPRASLGFLLYQISISDRHESCVRFRFPLTRASIRISGRLDSVGVIAIGKYSGARVTGSLDFTRRRRLGAVTPRTPIYLRSRFALIPLASAIPATDIPGSLHARTRSSLNSSLCLRLRRGGFSIPIVSTIVLSGHHGAQLHRLGIDDFPGRLRSEEDWLITHKPI